MLLLLFTNRERKPAEIRVTLCIMQGDGGTVSTFVSLFVTTKCEPVFV